MSLQQTDLLEVAAKFVNSTGSHIFLTGKAGTGKTTFLRDLALKTHKRFVVVAPTGIAALNAQGVTIHSQFLLPLGSFIPEREPAGVFTSGTNFFTQFTLTRKHPLNSMRKQVLRAIDLLIIDEVSMLRADILDAVDYRMRSVKGDYRRSFGGAQVLMIGDLYQLPPIVRDHEWQVLREYYRSMHFFEARALKEDGMVYIELDKIFRQQDEKFIGILNNLRNNITTEEDIAELNSHYRREDSADSGEEIITITTHNYKADAINTKKLADLPGKEHFFTAEMTGDFPEKLYPLPEKIALKEGAQVMFIKNDTSGEMAYYNGRLAKVESIEGGKITVVMADTKSRYVLRKEQWENKKYVIDETSKELEEEVTGTFVQYPVKLAWAVTVHKSQGLTFDKAVIDVGQAFAPGQVYVALSRLRSLDGLTLRTRINTYAISTDVDVKDFTQNRQEQKPLPVILQEQQRSYLKRLLPATFDFSAFEKQIYHLQKNQAGKMEFEDAAMRKAMGEILGRVKSEKENTVKFRKQLETLLGRNETEKLLERIGKGSAYYTAFMEENLRLLLIHLAEVELFTRTKTYRNALSEIDQLVMKSLEGMNKAAYIADCIIAGREISRIKTENEDLVQRRAKLLKEARKAAEENPKFATRKSGRRRKKGKKREKGETYKITYTMLNEGLDIKEIASKRGLAVSTIESHIVRGIKSGDVRISDIFSDEIVEEIVDELRDADGLGTAFAAFKGKYSYNVLRMVQVYLDKH